MDYYERALRLNQETGNKQWEASAYRDLGNAYNSLGDYTRAVDYHERSLRLNQETGYKPGEVTAYGNLGNAAIVLVTIKGLWTVMGEHLDLTKKLRTNNGKL